MKKCLKEEEKPKTKNENMRERREGPQLDEIKSK